MKLAVRVVVCGDGEMDAWSVDFPGTRARELGLALSTARCFLCSVLVSTWIHEPDP